MGNSSFKDIASNGMLSAKEMKDLQTQILLEYPFLSNIYESMLVSDNNRPDCPIVYANDQFEAMTLYSKEEILGRNCRFLQGKHTDKSIVKKIRHAVDNNLPIDVEILNYRKDGIAFWNSFLMLPVHAKGTKTGKADYFIAIQKDMTMLKEVGKNPGMWTPPEVAMWLEQQGSGQYGKMIIDNGINGEIFLDLDKDDLQRLGIVLGSELRKMLQLIKGLNGSNSPDNLSLVSERLSDLRAPSASSSSRSLEHKLPRNRSSTYSSSGEYVVPNQKIVTEWANSEDIGEKANTIWSKSPSSKIAIKCTMKGSNESQLLLSNLNVSWADFTQMIEKNFGTNLKISYFEDGYNFQIVEEGDLHAAMTQYAGQTLPLTLERTISAPNINAISANVPNSQYLILKNLPSPVIVVDATGFIRFANTESLNLFGFQKQKEIRDHSLSVVSPQFPVEKISQFAASHKKRIYNVQTSRTSSEAREFIIRDTGLSVYTITLAPVRS